MPSGCTAPKADGCGPGQALGSTCGLIDLVYIEGKPAIICDRILTPLTSAGRNGSESGMT
jgi:hypothetical protein